MIRLNKWLPAAFIGMLLLAGCSTLFTASVALNDTVKAMMNDWAELSVTGQTTLALDEAVIVAHNHYRKAAGVAKASLIAYKNGGDQQAYVAAIEAARTAADGIFAIIRPLLTKAKADAYSRQIQKAER